MKCIHLENFLVDLIMNIAPLTHILFFWKPTIGQRDPADANHIQNRQTEDASSPVSRPLEEKITGVGSETSPSVGLVKIIFFRFMGYFGVTSAHIHLGQIYLECGDLDKAFEYFEKAEENGFDFKKEFNKAEINWHWLYPKKLEISFYCKTNRVDYS